MREALHMPVPPKNDYILMQSISATTLLFKRHHWLGLHLPVLYVDFKRHTSEKGQHLGERKKNINAAKSRNFSCSLEVVFGLTR